MCNQPFLIVTKSSFIQIGKKATSTDKENNDIFEEKGGGKIKSLNEDIIPGFLTWTAQRKHVKEKEPTAVPLSS